MLIRSTVILALLFSAHTRVLAQSNLTSGDAAALVERMRPAMAVLLSVDRRGKTRSYGTGFFITGDGVLVTARHVAEAEVGLVALTSDGKRRPITGFIGEDSDYDVSVLRVEGYGGAHLDLAAAALPPTNQWVALVSAQDRIAPSCSTGSVALVMNFSGLFAVIATTIPVRPGQSGSPLLNAGGEVLGVVPYISPKDSATASPVSAVRKILDRAGGRREVAFGKRPRNGSEKALFFDADFRSAVEALERHDWPEAEARMRRVAKRSPESPLAFTTVGAIQVQRGDFKKAEATLDKALRLNPDSALAHLLKGVCLAARSRVTEGLAAARKSIELGLPDRGTLVSAWEFLARTEDQLGHREESREALEKLGGLDPGRAAILREELQATNRASNAVKAPTEPGPAPAEPSAPR